MILEIVRQIDEEIVHYADSKHLITSRFNRVNIIQDGSSKSICLPVSGIQRLAGATRLSRRALRLDKCCIVPSASGYIAFWQGGVYHIASDDQKPVCTHVMSSCRNPMHNSMANVDGKELFYGEYGRLHPDGKSICRTRDGGESWETVYNIPCSRIRHIHGCKWDPYEEKVWVFTGDSDGEAWIICADRNFNHIEWIGNGTQAYRTCSAFFSEDSVYWIMDSPLQEVHIIRLDRKTRQISAGQIFPGPVWYSRKLDDGIYIACTVQETGPSHKDRCLHFMVSDDLEHWEEAGRFEHDGLPKGLMKYGVAAFADGAQTSGKFYMFFEAVKGLDGKSCLCKLTNS